MTIAQTKAWFNGSDGPDNVCQAYPDGQCTWWACMRGHKIGLDVGSYWGNGGDWAASATAAGWKTTRTDPVAGSIVSYPPGVADADTLYGHVAVVEAVDRTAGSRDHQRDERARRPGHRQPPHAQDQRRRGLHPAQRQCVHQWFRRHGFHVIRFRIVRFVVIVRLVLLFGSGGGGMDVLQFRSGSTDVVVDYDGDGTHATPEQARAIARKMIASYKDWGDATMTRSYGCGTRNRDGSGMPPTRAAARTAYPRRCPRRNSPPQETTGRTTPPPRSNGD